MNEYFNLEKPILIIGETGTGKSVLAKKIFEESQIFKKSFLLLNLATIKPELIESELFGHKKGSFTGAFENKIGYFQEASGGTLFIDEIGEIPLEVQKRLLMVLEEGEFSPIGDTKKQKLNCRLIFATNKDLKIEVKEKYFREDLYFRINRFPIEQLPLRNLANKKIQILNYIQTYSKAKISDELLNFFMTYEFPGNWRELRNIVEFLEFKDSKNYNLTNLPNYLKESKRAEENVSYLAAFEAFEKKYLEEQLILRGGRVVETAKEIGISKAALIYKTKKYGIDSLQIKAKHRESLIKVAA